jgi:hypothetical protein
MLGWLAPDCLEGKRKNMLKEQSLSMVILVPSTLMLHI